MKKKVLTKAENNRRYRLHQIIKAQHRYHPKTKIIEVDSIQSGRLEPKVSRALNELQKKFGYSLQFTIPDWKLGDTVRIHPRYEHPMERGKFYDIIGISGKTATIKRNSGRWRKPFAISINRIIPIKKHG